MLVTYRFLSQLLPSQFYSSSPAPISLSAQQAENYEGLLHQICMSIHLCYFYAWHCSVPFPYMMSILPDINSVG